MSGKRSIDGEKVRELHASGMNDGEMAERLGCSSNAILYWRQQLGLKAIGRKGRKPKAESKAVIETPKEAAANIGRGPMVSICVEILDLIWEGLGPQEKAALINSAVHLGSGKLRALK